MCGGKTGTSLTFVDPDGSQRGFETDPNGPAGALKQIGQVGKSLLDAVPKPEETPKMAAPVYADVARGQQQVGPRSLLGS
jgi:hypothetical protein